MSCVLRLGTLGGKAGIAAIGMLACGWASAFTPPSGITVVTDFDYPPFLFRTDDGELKGIIREKWDLWSKTTGVQATVKGMTWSEAQQSVQQGNADVIDALSHTDERAALYEYSPPYAPVEAHVYFHRSISGISDAASMRGFTIGAKQGSACGNWLSARGIGLREYPGSQALIEAAGRGEIRLFCMDSLTAHYYLYKMALADEFRKTPALYATRFHWAVKKGRADLRDFIQAGYERIPADRIEEINNQWVGNPIRVPIADRYFWYLAITAEIALVLYLVLLVWNRTLRTRVATRTGELNKTLGSLGQAVRAGNVGLFDWDMDTNRVRYSAEWKRQIGYSDDEITDAYAEWLDRLHPGDRDRALQSVRDCLVTPPHECRLEFRFRHKDGSYRWILAQAAVQFGPDGKRSRMLGSHVDITEDKRIEALLAGQSRVHELVANGAPLEQSLDSLLRVVEANATGMLCSILLLDRDGVHIRHLAAPTLPPEFCRGIDGAAIGEAEGSCGTSMYRREPVIVEDIATDPRWARYRDLALANGLRAAWSTPIFDAEKRVLGSFALYFTEPRKPTEAHRQLIALVTHCAAIAITQRREQIALRGSEERLRVAVTGARLGTWHFDLTTRQLTGSETSMALLGLPPESLLSPARFLQALHPDDRDAADDALRRALKKSLPYEGEYRVLWPDGSIHWLAARGQAYPGPGDRTARMEGIVFDITERKQADARIKRLDRVHALLSSINSVIVRVRDDQELVEEACRLAVVMGRFKCAWIAMAGAAQQGMRLVASRGADAEFRTELEASLAREAGAVRRYDMRETLVVNRIEADWRPMPMREAMQKRAIRAFVILPLVAGGEAFGALGLYTEVADSFDAAELELLNEIAGDIAFGLDHIRKEERLTFLVHYDGLTGLANRALFHDRLSAMLDAAARDGQTLALCIVDLDHFKDINDALGRQNGDLVLVEFARRLLACAEHAEQVARLGSDSFAIAMPGLPPANRVPALIEGHLDSCTGESFRMRESELHIAARFGVALYPVDGSDADALFRNAEAALKSAKAGGERVTFHTRQMTERVGERVALESRLRRALDNDEFVLHYQPKVDAAGAEVTGLEALLRWKDPRDGLALPATFVPVLEESGMILEVGAWAIRRAIADHSWWLAQGIAAPRVAVNVSAVQLRQRDFVEMIAAAIAHSAFSPPLDIEITETVIMKDVEANVGKLREIHDLGVKIAIDDFGTGYSSLGYLARLPVQVLKIDVSFIARMAQDSGIMTLVTTMISLAHSLGLTVVAEGVETEDQANALQRLGCDELQGFLIARPLTRDQVVELLQRRTLFAA